MANFYVRHTAQRPLMKAVDLSALATPAGKVTETSEEKPKSKKKGNRTMKADIAENLDALMSEQPESVRVLKQDRGLFERAESSVTVLTQDNKRLLND